MKNIYSKRYKFQTFRSKNYVTTKPPLYPSSSLNSKPVFIHLHSSSF